jgi:NAD-dependent deacetylase
VLQGCDALLVVWASGVVDPAAGLPQLVKRRRKPVIEINPVASDLTSMADVHWSTTAAEGLPKVVISLSGQLNHGMPRAR